LKAQGRACRRLPGDAWSLFWWPCSSQRRFLRRLTYRKPLPKRKPMHGKPGEPRGIIGKGRSGSLSRVHPWPSCPESRIWQESLLNGVQKTPGKMNRITRPGRWCATHDCKTTACGRGRKANAARVALHAAADGRACRSSARCTASCEGRRAESQTPDCRAAEESRCRKRYYRRCCPGCLHRLSAPWPAAGPGEPQLPPHA